jgi:cardiolipin synthase
MNNYTIFLNAVNFIFVVNIAFAVIVIIFEKRNANNTWTWLMIMLFIPFIGFIMYLFFGQNLRRKKFFVLKKEEESILMQFSDEQKRLLNDQTIVNNNSLLKEYHDVINLNLHSDNFIVTNNNKVDLLNNGDEKFPLLIDCIKNAKKFIHIQYYIFQDDNLGTQILNLLVEKAKEGIEVKLLYDGMGCIRNKKHFFDPLTSAGGEVNCFFPPFVPYINVRINYRNHRKICVIDGEHGFVGGLNIGDEYLGLDKKFGFWRDTHLHLQGDSVNYLEVRFLMDWRFASEKDFFMEEKYFPRKQYRYNTAVQIISSGPDSEWCTIRNTYLKLINKAENSIYIETPYFIPDDSILTALKIACLSGVDIKIIIPCKPDHPFIYWASKSYIWELVECGVKCYTYDNGFIHSKMVSIDGKMCTIGTANMDMRSFNLNFEVNAIIYDKKTTAEVDRSFEADILKSTLLTAEHYAKRPKIIKFKEAISRLLSPLL